MSFAVGLVHAAKQALLKRDAAGAILIRDVGRAA